MGKWIRSILAILLLVGLGLIAWRTSRSREPGYQGKRLSQWLDEYNRAGSAVEAKLASEAIRAMGTNSLPFLLAHIKHTNSPIQERIFGLFRKQSLIKVRIHDKDPYVFTSISALHVLGSVCSLMVKLT